MTWNTILAQILQVLHWSDIYRVNEDYKKSLFMHIVISIKTMMNVYSSLKYPPKQYTPKLFWTSFIYFLEKQLFWDVDVLLYSLALRQGFRKQHPRHASE